MATKKFIEVQEFSNDDLLNELKETKVQYSKMKFDHAIKGLENPIALKDVRRDIARLSSEARRRQLIDVAPESRTKLKARRRRNN